MLIIAIGHGSTTTDPFTTSVDTRPWIVNPDDRQACLNFICQEKNLQPEQVDCILVVDNPHSDAEPEVMHNYTEFD